MTGVEHGIEDDTSIPDNSRFLRRVPPGRVVEGPRPDSSNFEERGAGEGLSVTLWEGEGDLEATVVEKPEFGIVSVTAVELRAAGYSIVRKPLADNANHCECFGCPNSKKRRKLSQNAKWVKVPNGRSADEFGELQCL